MAQAKGLKTTKRPSRSESKKRKVWIVVDHPQQLAIALGVVSGLGPERFIFNLLISPHGYWEKVDISLYKDQFYEVIYLERPDYTWHPVRVLRMIFQIQRLKRQIAQLNIDRDDIIIGLSIFHYLENVVLSMHPDNLKIAVIPAVVYEECTRYMDKNIYYTPPEGWVARFLIEPLTGLHRTYCMRERQYPYSYWMIRYIKPVGEIFDKVVVLVTMPEGKYQEESNVITIPFPYILAMEQKETAGGRQPKPWKVVFFGTNFAGGMWGMTPEVYARNLNLCLSFLREKYGSTHRLVYRPHPAEKEEMNSLDLSQFEIESDGMIAELYFYQNINDIYAVFSVESISSRSGFDFFINSYVFLNVFPYDEAAKKHFRLTQAGTAPDSFYIGDLSSTPDRYMKTEDIEIAVRKCQHVLNTILPDKQE